MAPFFNRASDTQTKQPPYCFPSLFSEEGLAEFLPWDVVVRLRQRATRTGEASIALPEGEKILVNMDFGFA